MGGSMNKIVIPALFLALLSGMAGIVAAHPPSGMDIRYDQGTGQLVVIVDHTVENPDTHYIRSVTLVKNKGPQRVFQYNSQPSADKAVYRFDMPVSAGDQVTVSATCNLFGSIGKTVPAEGTEIPGMAPIGEMGGVNATVTPGGSTQGISPSSLWPVHAGLMVLGVLVVLGAGVLAVRKQIRGWYRYHRFIGAGGSLLVIAGIATAFIMVAQSGGPHLRVVHGILGMVTLCLLVLVLAVGFAREYIRKGDPWMRRFHIWTATAAIALLVLNILSGLAMTVGT